jgi:hypothetical protein
MSRKRPENVLSSVLNGNHIKPLCRDKKKFLEPLFVLSLEGDTSSGAGRQGRARFRWPDRFFSPFSSRVTDQGQE